MEDELRVRVVVVDYVLKPPRPGLDCTHSRVTGVRLGRVPVVRVFGSTPDGQKVCAHVHSVFPYILIRLDGESTAQADVAALAVQLTRCVNAALDAAGQADGGARGRRGRTREHVFAALLREGTPIYGYHAHTRFYLKLCLVDPAAVSRVTALLHAGVILGRAWEVAEAHVPFWLQFFVDFNLVGMGQLRLTHARFRQPLPPATDQALAAGTRVLCESTVPMEWRAPADMVRESTCALELDCVASDIANPADVSRAALDTDVREVRLVRSLEGLWEEEQARLAALGGSQLRGVTPPSQSARQPAPHARTDAAERAHAAIAHAVRAKAVAAARSNAPAAPAAAPAASSAPLAIVGTQPDLYLEARDSAELDARADADAAAEAILDAWQCDDGGAEPTPPDEGGAGGATQLSSVPPASRAAPLTQGDEELRQLLALSLTPDSSEPHWLHDEMGALALTRDGGDSGDEGADGDESPDEDEARVTEAGAHHAVAGDGACDGSQPSQPGATPRQVATPLGTPLSLSAAELRATREAGDIIEATQADVRADGAGDDADDREPEEGSGSGMQGGLPAEGEPQATGAAGGNPLAAVAVAVASARLPSEGRAAPEPGPHLDAHAGAHQAQHALACSQAAFSALRPTDLACCEPRRTAVERMGPAPAAAARADQASVPPRASCTQRACARSSDSDRDVDDAAQVRIASPKYDDGARFTAWHADAGLRAVGAADGITGGHSDDDADMLSAEHATAGAPLTVLGRMLLPPPAHRARDGMEAKPSASVHPFNVRFERHGIPEAEASDNPGLRRGPVLRWSAVPPTAAELTGTLRAHNLPRIAYDEPHYRRLVDAPARQVTVHANRPFHLRPPTLSSLRPFTATAEARARGRVAHSSAAVLRYVPRPPSAAETTEWLAHHRDAAARASGCIIEGAAAAARNAADCAAQKDAALAVSGAGALPRLHAQHCRPVPVPAMSATTPPSPHKRAPPPAHDQRTSPQRAEPAHGLGVTTMVVEVAAATRGELMPDPRIDAILLIGLAWWDDNVDAAAVAASVTGRADHGPADADDAVGLHTDLLVSGHAFDHGDGAQGIFGGRGHAGFEHLTHVRGGECALLRTFCDKVTRAVDPDVIVGYDTVRASIGYIVQRGEVLGLPMRKLLGRDAVGIMTTAEERAIGIPNAGERAEPLRADGTESMLQLWDERAELGDDDEPFAVEHGDRGEEGAVAAGALAPKSPLTAACDEKPAAAARLFPETPPDAQQHGGNAPDDRHGEGRRPKRLTVGWGERGGCGVPFTGRVVLNGWRLARDELKLRDYTFESVVRHVLGVRTPHLVAHVICRRLLHGSGPERWSAAAYISQRVRLLAGLVEALETISRTSELASVFGLDFVSVITRGSQLRVESVLLRLAKPRGYVLLSPSKQAVASQPPLLHIPLILEPEGRVYTSPVLVLDFRSLYPSLIIAYNLCYSTAVGEASTVNAAADEKLERVGSSTHQPRRFGAGSLRADCSDVARLAAEDSLFVAPNGLIFLKSSARPGVLPRLVAEILDTRVMVKGALKRVLTRHGSSLSDGDNCADERVRRLRRSLDARQLGLKLLANVTYGYTSASFSGRMPCAPLADAIVSLGRETLHRAINAIVADEDGQFMGARVVYGDTDSLFVEVPGASRAEAFEVGRAIAARVTATEPHPVELEFEKVYHPCVLVTKKRYAGFAWTSVRQGSPAFEVKGLESVRRDSCAAVAKTMDRALRLLFESGGDLSLAKAAVQRALGKLAAGTAPISDYVFAKEVRLGTYRGLLPPAAVVAARALRADPMVAPQLGERVPYVVVAGGLHAKLDELVVSPREFLARRGALQLHATYYITKQLLPALQRVLGLAGADVSAWFAAVPRSVRAQSGSALAMPSGHDARIRASGTIRAFYASSRCVVCDDVCVATLCTRCKHQSPQLAACSLAWRAHALEAQLCALDSECARCGERPLSECTSLDCAVYLRRQRLEVRDRIAGTARANIEPDSNTDAAMNATVLESEARLLTAALWREFAGPSSDAPL